MNIKEYAPLALRTARALDYENSMLNAALGLTGEAGEVADTVKKVIFHDKPLDRDHLIAELGDICWYLNLMIHALGTSWDEVMERNIKKLETRYPDLRFDAGRANNRDVEAEKRAMIE